MIECRDQLHRQKIQLGRGLSREFWDLKEGWHQLAHIIEVLRLLRRTVDDAVDTSVRGGKRDNTRDGAEE